MKTSLTSLFLVFLFSLPVVAEQNCPNAKSLFELMEGSWVGRGDKKMANREIPVYIEVTSKSEVKGDILFVTETQKVYYDNNQPRIHKLNYWIQPALNNACENGVRKYLFGSGPTDQGYKFVGFFNGVTLVSNDRINKSLNYKTTTKFSEYEANVEGLLFENEQIIMKQEVRYFKDSISTLMDKENYKHENLEDYFACPICKQSTPQ